MGTDAQRLPPWDETDLAALLTLDELARGHLRSRFGDANLNGRSYGGQLLGQAMAAAAQGVPEGRAATTMQFLFLQGAVPDEPIDFKVSAVQDGKRFSSRQVVGTQRGGRGVLDAQVSFALPLPAPEHTRCTAAQEHDPDELSPSATTVAGWEDALRRLGGYSLREKACFDFRVPDLMQQMAPGTEQARFRFWLKLRQPLSAQPAVHSAAFAYLSDWWLTSAAWSPMSGSESPTIGSTSSV